jgi:hypothetical protein
VLCGRSAQLGGLETVEGRAVSHRASTRRSWSWAALAPRAYGWRQIELVVHFASPARAGARRRDTELVKLVSRIATSGVACLVRRAAAAASR